MKGEPFSYLGQQMLSLFKPPELHLLLLTTEIILIDHYGLNVSPLSSSVETLTPM